MYNPYLTFTEKYFPKAQTVVDSFHVVQYLISKILQMLNTLQKRYRQRDEELKKEKEEQAGHKLRLPQSDEYYLLKNHKWIMLTNVEHINYSAVSHWDRHFRYYMDTYAYEEHFFAIHASLREIRDLKEKYIRFNRICVGDERKAAEEIDKLIAEYLHCPYELFHDFSRLLKKHRESIIRSFITIDTQVGKVRLSNGPIESLNRKPKDIKRNARGYRNFDHIRNRILYSLRTNAPILAQPRKDSAFKRTAEKQRGSYKKNTPTK